MLFRDRLFSVSELQYDRKQSYLKKIENHGLLGVTNYGRKDLLIHCLAGQAVATTPSMHSDLAHQAQTQYRMHTGKTQLIG